MKLRHGSLFSGIAGWETAAIWAGWENVFHCEINPFGQGVIKHHHPNSIEHENVLTTDFNIYRDRIDVLTASTPCQPFSTAGKQKGTDDTRHLWPATIRIVREIRPRWFILENVRGLVSWNDGLVFDQVQSDLEAAGYEVIPFLLPACGVNAPHQRYRIWFIAYLRNQRCDNRSDNRQERHLQTTIERELSENQSEREGREFGSGEIGSDGSGIISNSHSIGECNGPRSVQETDGKISQRNNNAKSCNPESGFAKNANGDGQRSEFWEEEPEVGGLRDSGAGNNVGGYSDNEEVGITANAQSEGSTRQSSGEKSPHAFDGFDGFDGDVADTKRSRRRENFRRGESGLTNKKSEIGDWSNFPTVSPLRFGNDGFSNELLRQRIREDSMGLLSEEEIDSIISKATSHWVKETIKASGNAIVSQVVYQIFKAINEYEKL